MDKETVIETDGAEKQDTKQPAKNVGFYLSRIALHATCLFAAYCVGRELGNNSTDQNWVNMLIATRLAEPGIAESVKDSVFAKRHEFKLAADANRKIHEAAEILRKAQPGSLMSKPQPGRETAGTEKATKADVKTEPKAETP